MTTWIVVLPCAQIRPDAELSAHHANAADDAMDHCFIDYGPQPRPVIAARTSCRAGRTSSRRSTSSGSSSIGPFLKISARSPPSGAAGTTTRVRSCGSRRRRLPADVDSYGFGSTSRRMPPPGLAGLPGRWISPSRSARSRRKVEKGRRSRAGGGSARSRCGTGSGRPSSCRATSSRSSRWLAAALEFHRQPSPRSVGSVQLTLGHTACHSH